MKYIITDQEEARVGSDFHSELARGCKGKVIAAGHCRYDEGLGWIVWGSSVGYEIMAKKEDAQLLSIYIKGDGQQRQEVS